MTYLLDTHTFLWLLRSPEMLPLAVRAMVVDRSSALALSVVTPWEMAIKQTTGKLKAAEILDNFERVAALAGITILDTTIRQVIRGGRLPLHHRDPFDRLLAAQALELRIPLVSRDHVFDLYGVKRIWD
ncbi:MAG: type II toxin-antitoxin system VapC family toxin [Terracidiphilus sp.]|jgi:PIN domain nuclease of toxin-antitoxin system